MLFLFGHMRDFYRKKIWGGRSAAKQKEGYAPIRQDYEVSALVGGWVVGQHVYCGFVGAQAGSRSCRLHQRQLGAEGGEQQQKGRRGPFPVAAAGTTGCHCRHSTARAPTPLSSPACLPTYPPLPAPSQDFYTRRMYYRIHDTFNRPICSAPDAWIDVMRRTPVDGQK